MPQTVPTEASSERFAAVDTPCAVIDLARLERNLARMNAIAARLGVQLRPHVKTAKCVPLARRIFGGASGPITVSTLREAEYFFAAGFNDLLYAVSFAPAKLARAAALARSGAQLRLIGDDAASIAATADAAERAGVCFDVLLEIDADGHRAGLRPDDARIVAIARRIRASAGLRFAGVMTHAGAAYACADSASLRRHAERERDAVVTAAAMLRAAGIDCACVSVGSTPTLSVADDLTGVTEARAGVYVFNDLVQSNLGVCALDDIALSVLTTVIGHKRDTGCVIVDAGGLALSKDHGTAGQAVDYGYGQICAEDGRLLAGLRVADVNQEHGLIRPSDPAATLPMFAALPIGSRVRVLPNHACMTAVAYSSYCVDDGTAFANWPRCNGW